MSKSAGAANADNPFTCIDGSEHDFIPDGGCKVCRKCGFSPCA